MKKLWNKIDKWIESSLIYGIFYLLDIRAKQNNLTREEKLKRLKDFLEQDNEYH